jgi:hypothetical protein
MNKISFLFFLISVLSISECYPCTQQDSVPGSDIMLTKVKSLLPKGWSMSSSNDTLFIQRDDSAYIFYENRINAPVSRESREEINKRIIKNGFRERPGFIIRFYTKLDSSELATSKVLNITLQKIIYALPEKFDIEYLRDKFAMSKGEEIYTGKTDEEKERIEDYYKEKNKMLKEIPRLPDFNSEKYSLYLDMVTGMEDQMHLVYPYDISTEIYKIRELLNENLIMIN